LVQQTTLLNTNKTTTFVHSKSNQRNPEHTYTTKGNYQVMLVAYNNTSSNTFRHTVSVQKSISACFTVSGSNHVVYEAINFTNCSVNANEFEWDFGDGTSSTQENPSHEYTTAGTYEVTLTAGSSDYNSTYSYTQNITILNTTDLDILVLIDGTEIVVPNAEVTLYGNFDDWENLTNPISDILLTNADGTVIFYDLNPVVYFIDAYKDAGAGEYQNTEGATSALNLNGINYYQVFIKYFDDSKNRRKIFRRIKKSSKEEHDRIIKANKSK